MSIKKLNDFIQYVFETIVDNGLDYKEYLNLYNKLDHEIQLIFSINSNDKDIFDKRSRKMIMLDYNFSIIFKKIAYIYRNFINSIPLITIDIFEKRLTFILSRLKTFENFLKPIYRQAQIVLNKRDIKTPTHIFSCEFEIFIYEKRDMITKLFKKYFITSSVDCIYSLTNTVECIQNLNIFNSICNLAKETILVKYISIFKDSLTEDINSNIKLLYSICNAIYVKYKYFINDEDKYQVKTNIITFYLEDLNNLFIISLKKCIPLILETNCFLYLQIKQLYLFISKDITPVLDILSEELLKIVDNENFIDSYNKIIDICNNKFDKHVINNVNKKIVVPNEEDLAKHLAKFVFTSLTNHEYFKKFLTQFYLYQIVNRETMAIFYQNSLSKRLIFNENINLKNEYHILDQLQDFPLKSKLNHMLYDYSISQSLSVNYFPQINVIFGRDQIWPIKQTNTSDFKFAEQDIITDLYTQKYEGRKLYWRTDLTTCTITMNIGDSSYDLIVNPQIVDFIQKFNSLDKVKNTKVDTKYFKKLEKYKILKVKNDLVIFNKKFKCKQKVLKCFI